MDDIKPLGVEITLVNGTFDGLKKVTPADREVLLDAFYGAVLRAVDRFMERVADELGVPLRK